MGRKYILVDNKPKHFASSEIKSIKSDILSRSPLDLHSTDSNPLDFTCK